MKTKRKELDVDFIGGEHLTKDEENALSEYFKQRKKIAQSPHPRKRVVTKQKVTI